MIKSIFSFRTLGYLFFALIVTVALLVARFPGEKIKYSCEKRIEHLFPGSSCNIGEVALTFPPAMTIKNIKVSRGINGQDAVMKVDRLSLIPKPLQFWKSYTVKGQVYAGLLEAELGIDREKATFQLTNIRLEGVQVAGIAESIGLGEREVSGLVEFSGEYRGTLDQPGDGTGKGVLQITNGSLELLQPILALPTLDFNKVTIGVSQESKYRL